MGTSYRKSGDFLSVACTDPATPVSGAPVRVGDMMGVAATVEGDGGNTSTEATVEFRQGVYDLSVKAADDVGNVAVAFGDKLFYVDADTPKLSKKASGRFFGFALETVTSGSTDTIYVFKPAPHESASGTKRKGVIQLDITTAKLISGNAIGNLTEGMLPDGNSAPSLARVNGATDKAVRLGWAATVVTELQFAPIAYPPDWDGSYPVTVNILAAMGGATDTPTIGVAAFEGVGDTDCGGNTAAVTGTTVAKYSVTLTAANIGESPNFLNLSITPAAHGTDALYVYGVYVEYTRK